MQKHPVRLLSIFLAIVISIASAGLGVTATAATLKGDANSDGKITTADARLALRFAIDVTKPTDAQKTAADYDGDGKVSLKDARSILCKAADTNAAITSYEEKLLAAGFPQSYLPYITALHENHPKWNFVPFVTGVDWNTAINNERTPHSQQLIENVVKSSFMCSCSSCKGVIQENPNWVSASYEALEYYMDPRNFLDDEAYIFQYEDTSYSASDTAAGVEAILNGTWMYNAYISYKDASGNTKYYTVSGNKIKYSQAILNAARDSGMSAYYLASKIKQEVGGSTNSAGGASGTNAPYYGIYNYYNIGAYTGVADGLKWANGYMSTTAYANVYKTASSSSEKLTTIPASTSLYYMGASGVFYKVRVTYNGKTYVGYVGSDRVSMYTSYGRPWTTPYASIYYGAQYINSSFSKYQFTGYLQKFNVNPESDDMYNHEYMGNVRAAASESVYTYDAYKSAGILEAAKTFSIPVFNNMDGPEFTTITPSVSVSAYSKTSVTLSWSKINKATGYRVYKYDSSTGKYTSMGNFTALSYTDSSLKAAENVQYQVKAYTKKSDGTYAWTKGKVIKAAAAPDVPTSLISAGVTASSVSLKWTGVSAKDGYAIYRYDDFTKKYTRVGKTTALSFVDSTAKGGTSYKYKVYSYKYVDSKYFYSSASNVLTAKTSGTAPTYNGTVNADGGLNLRKGPGTDYDIITLLPDGSSITIISVSGAWFKVKCTVGGTSYTGFVSAQYVKVTGVAVVKEVCPYSEPSEYLEQGDSGNGVKWLQWYLYKLSYLNESSDISGNFGSKTHTAVKAFQTAKNLVSDGVVGPVTRAELKNDYN